jgi:hypothetical protein
MHFTYQMAIFTLAIEISKLFVKRLISESWGKTIFVMLAFTFFRPASFD